MSTTTTATRERVLITGGGSGIGAAIAQACERDGYDPVVLDREHGDISVDLADAQATDQALQKALEAGPITRLVNNVGVVVPASAQEQTIAQFDLAVALNLRCAMQCLQALLPGMQEAGFGRVVNVSSRAALGKEFRSAYAATKAGLIGLTRVWALELGRHGITANAIGPGPIRTALFDAANPPHAPRTRAIVESIPVRRMGQPEDVAEAASYFLGLRSGFVTGQVLYVCGGMTAGVAGV
ncbi:MAG: SDR family oxidoreductase [Ottowia sp.]|uniref:SDR family NAD(P)-dependent oxidoreductase n=1 Tax=Ottowia sp. TaxID=1898956 RepID=UPI003C792F9F